MIIFVKLLLAHLLGDFILQPTSWVKDKESKKHKSIYLHIHTLIHGVLAWIFVPEISFVYYALLLAVLHGLIDYIKLRFQKTSTKRNWFVIDQFLHIAVISIITITYEHLSIDYSAFNSQFWICITAVLFLTKPTSIIIKNIISIWTPENVSETDTSLQNAGNYIGILERLLIFCFLITNHFDAIGFLLATKSIFRFGDLKVSTDRKLTEYVLIGTLLSFGIAILISFLAEHLILHSV